MNRKLVKNTYLSLFMLVGCVGNTNEQSTTDSLKNNSVDENTSKTVIENGNEGKKQDKEPLSLFSSEQIEYARIWLQLGTNQNIEELNVRHISAGEPLNPDDDTSASYPDDVIQLAGARLVDGSVTYSSNGDGTINVYNVPLRWDGVYPAGEEFYIDIIKNTELVYVNPGDDEQIIRIIELLNLP